MAVLMSRPYKTKPGANKANTHRSNTNQYTP